MITVRPMKPRYRTKTTYTLQLLISIHLPLPYLMLRPCTHMIRNLIDIRSQIPRRLLIDLPLNLPESSHNSPPCRDLHPVTMPRIIIHRPKPAVCHGIDRTADCNIITHRTRHDVHHRTIQRLPVKLHQRMITDLPRTRIAYHEP